MESTHNEKVQKLQQQLEKANKELQRSLDLNKEMKIEKERLIFENYSLIRQMAIQRNRYEEIRSSAAGITKYGTHLKNIVDDLLPGKPKPPVQVQVQSNPTVLMTSNSAVLMTTPKSALKPPSSTVSDIAKRPPIKHVEFEPKQLLQIKQKEDVNEKIVDLGKFFFWLKFGIRFFFFGLTFFSD